MRLKRYRTDTLSRVSLLLNCTFKFIVLNFPVSMKTTGVLFMIFFLTLYMDYPSLVIFNQYVAWFTAACRPYDPVRFQVVDQPCGTVVADTELPLQKRGTCPLFFDDEPFGIRI